MKRVEVSSYPVSIFIAGEVDAATDYARQYCDAHGLCVTVTPTTYVYTNGQEAGVIVGLINYPRFPSTPGELWDTAERLAAYLRERIYQDSYTIQAPVETVWFSHREADASEPHGNTGDNT